ncbi:MAG: hypothetical protein WEE89_16765 [Gemmatimonadota bacterium]
MPRNKDLKRLVRTRMKKTGEAYTTARAQIIRKPTAKKTAAAPAARTKAVAAQKKPDYAALAGMSDESVKEKTGCTWERWVVALDRAGAVEMSHGDIATLVNEKYKIDGWWSQAVTVGYERIKGLRERGQRRNGTYEANKSRTFSVPVSDLFNAWADASIRKLWLEEQAVMVRTANAPKSIRLGWPDGTIIAVGFESKGASKSSVALTHTKLRDKDRVQRLKQYWSEQLDALGEVLT